MKKLAALLPLLALVAIVTGANDLPRGQKLSVLAWEPGHPLEPLDGFKVYFFPEDTNAPALLVQYVAPQPLFPKTELPLLSILNGFSNGVYRVQITALAAGLESDRSPPLFFFWYGRPPAVPGNITVSFPAPPPLP